MSEAATVAPSGAGVVRLTVSAGTKWPTSEMHRRFDQVDRELGWKRVRMTGLESAVEAFLAGHREPNAV